MKALVLAAGLSSRMAQNKLLLTLGNKNVLQTTVECIISAGIKDITVVTGHMKEEIETALVGYKLKYVDNPEYAGGMGTSLRTGVRTILAENDFDAVLLFNGDTPFVKADTVKLIIKKYEESMALVVLPLCKGKRGHPVLMDRRLLDELMDIAGDVGAREIIEKHGEQTLTIDTEDDGVYQDIDSPEEYKLYAEKYRRHI